MHLVGRVHETAEIAAALSALRAREGGVLAFEGEAGIGKSRLLSHLTAAAEGCIVLEARASEFEADLPYALFAEALDRHVSDRRIAPADPAALASILPSLDGAPAPADRHRTHRALRDLLERVATRPLVLVLDDVHWADPASVDALAALIRRPPSAPVLVALAAREGQVPPALAGAFGGALHVTPLSEAEATELVGDAALYAVAGGNPFYLEQLARTGAGAVPTTVTAAIGTELSALSANARRLLDAAAVAGDPFELELADEVAELSAGAGLEALDELLARALVRPTTVPRRFAFRHPVVRHAVYTAAPAGWRLGAHARAADVLERRGASAVQRAHHVQYAARAGDEQAIAVLAEAAGALQASAPGTAAHFHAATLRLLPDDRARRITAQSRLADALAAAGDTAAARATLADAISDAQGGERLRVTVALANQDWWLGAHDGRPAPAARRPRRPPRAAVTGPHPSAPGAGADRAQRLRPAGRPRPDHRRPRRRPRARRAGLRGRRARRWSAGSGRRRRSVGCRAGGGGRGTRSTASTARAQATRLPALWMLARARRYLDRPDAAADDLDARGGRRRRDRPRAHHADHHARVRGGARRARAAGRGERRGRGGARARAARATCRT